MDGESSVLSPATESKIPGATCHCCDLRAVVLESFGRPRAHEAAVIGDAPFLCIRFIGSNEGFGPLNIAHDTVYIMETMVIRLESEISDEATVLELIEEAEPSLLFRPVVRERKDLEGSTVVTDK